MTPRRSIFIAGTASGIGRQTALLFAARGWYVGLADIDAEGLAQPGAVSSGPAQGHRRGDLLPL